MLNVSQQYQKQITADNRQFLLKADFFRETTGDNPEETVIEATVTGADSLVSVTLEEAAVAEERISMGNFCSTKMTMELIEAPSSLNYDQLMVKVYSGLLVGEDYEFVSLGVFYITEAETSNNFRTLTITAYDGACRLEDACEITRDFPMSLQDLTDRIAEEKGIRLHPDNVYRPYLLQAPLEGYTYRQMLGFAAGLMGCNVRFDRENRLQFYWYDTKEYGLSITREQQYLNGFIPKTKAPLTVTAISCTDGEKNYYRGQGTKGVDLVMENPYMTEEILETIWQEKIADMETAEETAVLPVTYDGSCSEESVFTAVYNQSLETLRVVDTTGIYPGTVLEMTYSAEETAYTEDILVTQVDKEAGRIAFLWEESEEGEEQKELTDGCSVSLKVRRQWIFDDEDAAMIQAGDVLKSSEGTAVTVTMIDYSKGELYLSDTAGSPIYGMEAGTEIILTKVQVKNYRLSYLPAELRWRGNPALEPSDTVLAEQEDGTGAILYVMKQTLQLSGGLSAQILCEGENETSAGFSSGGTGPIDKKLDRVYTSLQETILKATEKITGQTGGHVVINQSENGPAEILIMDTADIRTAGKVWRWNQGGLGYSSTGYEGPYATAITADGEIVGSFLQAESIAGSKLNIDSRTVEKIVSGINSGQQKINSAVLEIDSEDLRQAIRMEVSETGGFNKISNSSGAFGLQGWRCTGQISISDGTEERQRLVSGRAFVIEAAGTMETDASQTNLSLNIGKTYTLSALVKENDSMGQIALYMGETLLVQMDVGGSGGLWQKYEQRFQVPETAIGETFILKINAGNGALYVGDLLLTEGSRTTWSPYPGEVNSAALSMSQFGITINQTGAGTKTVIDSAGTRVISTEMEEEVVAEYTKDGVEAKTLIAKEQVAAGRVRMISMDEQQMAVWIINNDSEVDL